MLTKNALMLSSVALGLVALAACDYSGDFLFPEAQDDVRSVIDLGEIPVSEVLTLEDAAAAATYGQVSASGDARESGVTLSFAGTGSDVCVWVDPEFVTWSQSVATQGRNRRWAYPDNLEDDGDLDLEVGLAIYYDGSPNEEIGDFAIRYEDALGNPVEIALDECVIAAPLDNVPVGGTSGRGAPEHCTISSTQPGVSYIVKMSAWSTPIDDDRLGYGVLVADGPCSDLRSNTGVSTDTALQECLIPGEMIDPVAASASPEGAEGPWVGSTNAPTVDLALSFEQAFCDGERMAQLCEEEAEAKDCEVEQCFCGDPTDTPTGGAF